MAPVEKAAVVNNDSLPMAPAFAAAAPFATLEEAADPNAPAIETEAVLAAKVAEAWAVSIPVESGTVVNSISPPIAAAFAFAAAPLDDDDAFVVPFEADDEEDVAVEDEESLDIVPVLALAPEVNEAELSD